MGPPGAAPVTPPAGPPAGLPVGPPAGPPAIEAESAPTFDPVAEIEEEQDRKQRREDRLEELRVRRNRSRTNVYLVLALLTVFFVFSFFPVPQGDTSSNPHIGMSQAEVTDWMDDSDGRGWSSATIQDWQESKMWDGNDPNSGAVESTVTLPGSPVHLGTVTEITVDVTLVGLREDGGSTSFRVGLFEGVCSELWTTDFNQSVAYYDGRDDLLLPGLDRTITLKVQPGTYCFYFQYMHVKPSQNGFKATIDIELKMYWPRGILLPLSGLLAIIALPMWIGTQRLGKEYKALKYPERPDRKSREQQVLDAADAERVIGMDLTGGENVDDEYVQQFLDQGYSHDVAAEHAAKYREHAGIEAPAASPPMMPPDQVVPEVVQTPPVEELNVQPVVETPSIVESQPAAAEEPAWTDEQLLAAGWTQEQIDAHRAQG